MTELVKWAEFHQESFLCQMPICYFSTPPNSVSASVDCHIRREFHGVEYGLDWKFQIHPSYQGRHFKIIDKVLMVIQSICYQQRFQNPIKVSIYDIARRMGYKDPANAYEAIREALDYLQTGFIVTNVYKIRDGSKGGNIEKEKWNRR